MVMIKKHNKILSAVVKMLILLFLIFTISVTNNIEVKATTEVDITAGNELSELFGINVTSDEGESGISSTLQIVLVLTVIALCPSILIMLTSFTRILIVLHFTRSALNTQSAPPNQVLIAIALFLTFFIMSPVFGEVYTTALKPMNNGEITTSEAFDIGIQPIREFMFNQVNDKDLDAMCGIAGIETVSSRDEIPIYVLIPSFILSELRIAFWIGFLIYIPFIVIDMVVASTLMSMGMMMLPPTTISMPFKILLFVLADGWNLIIVNLMSTFVI